MQDCEEGAVKELLLKGESLQRRVPDQDKREQIRLKHNQLNSKYNTVKVKLTHTQSHPSVSVGRSSTQCIQTPEP